MSVVCFVVPAKFLCEAYAPYRLVYANRQWTEMTGYHQHEVLGGNLNCLQGPMTSKDRILHMIDQLRTKGHCEREILINYTKKGEAICCELCVRPVLTDGDHDLACGSKPQIGYFLTTVQQHPLSFGLNFFHFQNKQDLQFCNSFLSDNSSSSKSFSGLSESIDSRSNSYYSPHSSTGGDSNNQSSGDEDESDMARIAMKSEPRRSVSTANASGTATSSTNIPVTPSTSQYHNNYLQHNKNNNHQQHQQQYQQFSSSITTGMDTIPSSHAPPVYFYTRQHG